MEKRYFCIKVKQRPDNDAPEFVVFVANARDIIDWVGIRRIGENENGIQRVLKPPRVKAIKRYFESNPHNTIPVSAVIAFDPNTAVFEDLNDQVAASIPGIDISNGLGQSGRWGVLTFNFAPGTPENERPAIVVDGQHRLKGMAASNDEIPIGVAAYIGIEPQEQAFQFVVINNKAQKVDTKNVKAIVRNVDEGVLERRLLRAGVSYGKYPATLGDIDELDESPFYQLLDWPLNPTDNKKVQLTTIEACLRYIKEVLPILSEDEDTLKALFMALWNAIKQSYPALWNNNDKFFSKSNIIALNEFLIDKIENVWVDERIDIYDLEQIRNYAQASLEDITSDFWTTEWTQPLSDNAPFRGRIKDDLRKIQQNRKSGREWFNGLKLVVGE